MFRAKAKENVTCNNCSEVIDSCDDCNTWFDDDEDIFCDEIHSHFCKKCGGPKYKLYKIKKENSTLDDFP